MRSRPRRPRSRATSPAQTFGPALDAAAERLGRLETVIVTAADFAPQTELEADPERARSLGPALDAAAERLGRLETVIVTAADFAPQTELEAWIMLVVRHLPRAFMRRAGF